LTVICAVPMGNSGVYTQSRIMAHRFAKISSVTYAARTAVRNMLAECASIIFPLTILEFFLVRRCLSEYSCIRRS